MRRIVMFYGFWEKEKEISVSEILRVSFGTAGILRCGNRKLTGFAWRSRDRMRELVL